MILLIGNGEPNDGLSALQVLGIVQCRLDQSVVIRHIKEKHAGVSLNRQQSLCAVFNSSVSLSTIAVFCSSFLPALQFRTLPVY